MWYEPTLQHPPIPPHPEVEKIADALATFLRKVQAEVPEGMTLKQYLALHPTVGYQSPPPPPSETKKPR